VGSPKDILADLHIFFGDPSASLIKKPLYQSSHFIHNLLPSLGKKNNLFAIVALAWFADDQPLGFHTRNEPGYGGFVLEEFIGKDLL